MNEEFWEKYNKAMVKLQTIYALNAPEVSRQRENTFGIRSSQIAALVMMLVEVGVFDDTLG